MKLAYVGGRLKIIPLIRQVQAILRDEGFVIDYDWTEHGSVRETRSG